MDENTKYQESSYWTAIVITCATKELRNAIEKEYRKLAAANCLPKHSVLLVVDDPKCPTEHNLDENLYESYKTTGVGSGGATINALLVAIERLSALKHYTTIRSDIVYASRILIIHCGRSLAHYPGGSAFLPISPKFSCVPPDAYAAPPTVLLHAMWMATKLGSASGNGVWVTSVDAFLPGSPHMNVPDTTDVKGALLCVVKSSINHAVNHGVIEANEDNTLKNMVFRMPPSVLKSTFDEQNCNVIAGVCFISAAMTEQLLGLHTLPPLDRCTYHGTDTGVSPLQVSLYFDLLLPLCTDIAKTDFTSGSCGATYAQSANYSRTNLQEYHNARKILWKQLSKFGGNIHILDNCEHHYLSNTNPYAPSITSVLPEDADVYHLIYKPQKELVSINSIIKGRIKNKSGKSTIIESYIDKDISLEFAGDAVLMGVHLKESQSTHVFPVNVILQGFPDYQQGRIITCYGLNDVLTTSCSDPSATYFNTPLSRVLEVFAQFGVSVQDLWPGLQPSDHSIFKAKLFMKGNTSETQMEILSTIANAITSDEHFDEWKDVFSRWKNCCRVSLCEAVDGCDLSSYLIDRDNLVTENTCNLLTDTVDTLQGKSLLPIFTYFAQGGNEAQFNDILSVLHNLVTRGGLSTGRLLANIADLLGSRGGPHGGLRSGPAANPQWSQALEILRAGNIHDSVLQMMAVCKQWISSGKPEDFVRAARHYERAAQIIISRMVDTAESQARDMWSSVGKVNPLGIGVWVEAQSPARLDLSGGWTDTPPICYEQGGAVLNVAIKVNGKKPLGVRVRFIQAAHIVVTLKDWSGGDLQLTWTDLHHLADYDNPVSPGALIKAVLHYCKLCDIKSSQPLNQQLLNKYGGGVEMEIWSRLPQGSGLGGSSILAGTMVAAVAVLLGHPPPLPTQLIHATLIVEQLLTTGGGWQDQVGGLIGGVKLGMSGVGTPLTVKSYSVPLSSSLLHQLNQRLYLLYTDKVRLARNLLQTVIRNWYAREPSITQSFRSLHGLALSAAESVLNEDLDSLGGCIGTYWQLKKCVASGGEPLMVSNLMSSLGVHCSGMSLAGAGGGGYMYALKKHCQPLPDDFDLHGLVPDHVEVDCDGLQVWVDDTEVFSAGQQQEILTHHLLKQLDRV